MPDCIKMNFHLQQKLNSTYKNDSMDSVMSNDKKIELYHQLSDEWGKAVMYARILSFALSPFYILIYMF